jgi:hypothetical protein
MVCELAIEERALALRAKGVLSLHFAKCEKMKTAVSDLKGQCVVLESTQVLQELVCNKILPLCHLHECYELLNSSCLTKSLPDSIVGSQFSNVSRSSSEAKFKQRTPS